MKYGSNAPTLKAIRQELALEESKQDWGLARAEVKLSKNSGMI
jgi:hypothetical protein